jgi:hypothetical protein
MVPPVSSSPAGSTGTPRSCHSKMVPPVSSSPAGSTGKPKPVPPCDSHCRQDGATLQSGTSTRHQDVPRWGHPSDRARRIGRSLGPRPNLQGKGRMPEPQHGATRQFVTSVRHRPFQVGATRQLGERSVPPPNPGGRSRVVAPSVRNSATPQSSGQWPLGTATWCHPQSASPNQCHPSVRSAARMVPPVSSGGPKQCHPPVCLAIGANTSWCHPSTRYHDVPRWGHPLDRTIFGATPQLVSGGC